ncbi:MAG: ATP-binding cassette domain-containing protein [Gemmatimonadota bacterium]|nr:ATP-binding cassette domain-containing protein [Gemmatimonadota bacterium]
MTERLTRAVRDVLTRPPRHVAGVVARERAILALVVPLAFLEAALDGMLTLSYRFLIDRAIVPGDRRALVAILAVLAAAVAGAAGLALWRDRVYVRWVARAVAAVRGAIFDHAQRLPVSYYAAHGSGDVRSRLSSDVAWLEAWLVGAVNTLLLPALSVLVGMALLVYLLPWQMAVAGILIWPLALIGPRIVAPRAGAAAYEQKAAETALLAEADEALAAHRVIKAYELFDAVGARFDAALGTLSARLARAGRLATLVERTTVISIYLVQVAAIAVAGYLAYERQLSLGAFIAFITVFWSLGWSIVVLARSAPSLVAAAASVRRVDELLAEPADSAETGGDAAPAIRESLALDGVTFGYDPGRPVLRDASLRIPRGAYVAIVGPSGSGKSSVLNLLARFYEPQQGAVRLDGADIRRYSTRTLRARMGFVFQDSVLFSASVRDNVRLGRLDATDADVEAAARAAEIHDFVTSLPQGYDTPVTAATLSGGQRQRLAIARALVRDPAVLVLDEATAALDPVAEAAINATLRRAGRGRTTIAVTHRLGTVVDADLILVLRDGRIVEQGTHGALLALDGEYAGMWRRQEGITVSGDGNTAQVRPQRLELNPMLRPLAGQLGTLATRFVARRAAAGEVVVRQGDPGDRFYLIVRGVVTVTREQPTGQPVELGRLADGDEFGELALLRDAPRNATVTARTDCLFLTLSRADFLALLEQAPDARAHVEAVARARLAGS